MVVKLGSENLWNFLVREPESLLKADADRRNQLMQDSPTGSDAISFGCFQRAGIWRAEPDPALFAVPSGYTVREGRPMHRPAPSQ